jgi:hypothetical protein
MHSWTTSASWASHTHTIRGSRDRGVPSAIAIPAGEIHD